MDRNEGTKAWAVRRRFMFSVSVFCMAIIAYVLWRELNTTPAEAAVTMAFITLAGIVGSYVFGAVWEDTTNFKTKAVFSRPSNFSSEKSALARSAGCSTGD